MKQYIIIIKSISNEKKRLEYLREQIQNECISYSEIAELQSLAEYIEAGDVVIEEWKDKINSLGARIIIEELLIETFNAGYKFGKSIHKK